MHRPLSWPLMLTCAVALTSLASACGSHTVSPLAVRTAVPSASATATVPSAPAATTSTVRPPDRPGGATATKRPATRPPAPRPTSTSTCRGTERYDLDLHDNELALIGSMCFKAGGVLRLQGIGPGLVTVTPSSLVSQHYEGGVVDVRFVRKGTVDVRIPQDEQVYTITVVIT